MKAKRLAFCLPLAVGFATAFIVQHWTIVREAAAPPDDSPVLATTLVLMGFGLCLAAYGLFLERHNLRANASRYLGVRLRVVRRIKREVQGKCALGWRLVLRSFGIPSVGLIRE